MPYTALKFYIMWVLSKLKSISKLLKFFTEYGSLRNYKFFEKKTIMHSVWNSWGFNDISLSPYLNPEDRLWEEIINPIKQKDDKIHVFMVI